MTKRKLHQLTGIIKGCFRGKVNNKSPYKNQSFYYLEIISESLFIGKQEAVLYVFPNLVNKNLWKVLEKESYKNKKYHFFYEKRVREGRLVNWEELK